MIFYVMDCGSSSLLWWNSLLPSVRGSCRDIIQVWQELDSMEQQENPNTRQQDRWKELAGALADDAANDVAEAVNESSGTSFLQTTARAQVDARRIS